MSLRRTLAVLVPWLVASCLSTPQKDTAGTTSTNKSMKARILNRDPNKRSSFEKALPSSMRPNSDTSGSMGRRLFGGTRQSSDMKSLAGVREYQVPTTKFGSKSSWLGRKAAPQGKWKAFGTSDTFSTDASKMATQSSSMSRDTFYASDDTFATSSEYEARKSQEKNTRPKIIERRDGSQQAAYTEDQVRELMNRN
jgi:hypothetical protein